MHLAIPVLPGLMKDSNYDTVNAPFHVVTLVGSQAPRGYAPHWASSRMAFSTSEGVQWGRDKVLVSVAGPGC